MKNDMSFILETSEIKNIIINKNNILIENLIFLLEVTLVI